MNLPLHSGEVEESRGGWGEAQGVEMENTRDT